MTRFYLSNVVSPYDPPLAVLSDLNGDWDAASTSTSKLSQIREGTAQHTSVTVNNTTANWDVMQRRFITDALTAGGTISETVQFVLKQRESHVDLNGVWHVHLWVTQGNSNTPRGTLLTDNIGTVEFDAVTSTGQLSAILPVNPVTVLTGDRIVAEIGYRANSTLTTYTGTLFRGGTTADSFSGDTSDANASWINLPGLTALAPNSPAQGEVLLAATSASEATGRAVGVGTVELAAGSALEPTGGLGPLQGELLAAAGSALDATGAAVWQGTADLAGTGAWELFGESGAAASLVAGSALGATGTAVARAEVTFAASSAVELTGAALAVPAFYGDISLVEFFALNANGTIRVPLPDVSGFTLSPLVNDAGTLSIEYPTQGANFSVLHEGVTSGTDLSVAVYFNGIVQPQLQGLLNESSGDDVEPGSVWTFAGNFNAWRLSEAVVVPKAGMPSQGEDDPEENDAHFYSLTAGQIMRTLLQEANTRGALTNIIWSSIGNTTDSKGVSWSKIITLKVSPGTDYLQMLLALVEYGMAEFEMRGLELRMYEFGTWGVDRAALSPPVVFRAGQSVLDSPRKHSLRDTATTLLVAGGSGIYREESSATALSRRGRRIEAFASQGSIHDIGTLTAYTQGRLGLLTEGKMEKTHGLTFGTGPQPVRDFEAADWVFSDLGDGLERLRVKQWTLSRDDAGKYTGLVVLNDLFAEAQAALVRRLRGIEGGSTITGTSQAREVTSGNDTTIPAAPTGLTVSSMAYLTDGGQIRTAATAQWSPVLLNTDGTSTDDIDLYLVSWRYTDTSMYTNPTLANWAFLPARQDETAVHHLSWSGLEPAKQVEVRVTSKDKAGHYSAWSASVFHTLAADVNPPPVPSTPITITQFGSMRIEWNGLGSAGEAMPKDFSRVEIHVSLVSGFTPTTATYWNLFTGQAATAYSNIDYGVTVFVRFVAVDISGNRSNPSAQASGTARQVVNADVFDGAVGSSKLADLAVVRAKIADLAVNNAKISDLAVGKLVTGTLTADLVLGANVATALSGARVGLNAQGFYAYNTASLQTVGINNDGSAFFLGEVATAASGSRFVFNPGGTNPTELRVYPNTGTDNYTRIKAGNVTDGLGGAHSILSILGDRYANDIGEPYLEMFGTRGTLGWGDTALTAPNHLARVAVDRYGPTLSGSVIRFNCEDRNVTTPDGYAEFNLPGGNVEIRKTLIAGENFELIRGTNRAVLLHNLGISSRNRSDTSDQPMYASAFNVGSARRTKTDIRELRADVLTKFDISAAQVWRYADDVAEQGDAAWWHVGPMAEDLPPEFVKPGIAGSGYVNVDDKVGILWETLRRTRAQLRSQITQLRSDVTVLQQEVQVLKGTPV